MFKSNSTTENTITDNKQNLLFILTGSISLYKVMTVLSYFKKLNYNIKVAASKNALQFVGYSTIEGLTQNKIHTETYESGATMEHIQLMRWASVIVAAPATANYINKMASGIADDLVSTLFLAHDFKKPFLVFPAMNTKMFEHPTTQASLAKLKSWGLSIHSPDAGSLACGEIGAGRLQEPEQMIQVIEAELKIIDSSVVNNNHSKESFTEKNLSLKNKIVITSGGTQEPIDNVRTITNISTGKTASLIAEELIEAGFEIIYIHAENAKLPFNPCQKIKFKTYQDLKNILDQLNYSDITCFIHAAAVSDYSLDQNQLHNQNAVGKINSDQEELILKFKKNAKLINSIKNKNKQMTLIGFKLTSSSDELYIKTKIEKLFQDSQSDYIVHNDWSSIQAHQHRFNFISKDSHSKVQLTLTDLIQEIYLVLNINNSHLAKDERKNP